MKLGAENKKMVVVALALFVIALLLLIHMLVGEANPAPAAAAGPAGHVASRPRTGKKAAPVLSASLDPRLRLDLLKQSEEVAYEGHGRNIFREGAPEIPTPVAPVRPQKPVPAVYTPPPPPPIDLKFFGFATRTGEAKKVFLSRGEDVFVAGEGDIVDRRYKILHIGTNSVEVEDLLSNSRQTLPLTQG